MCLNAGIQVLTTLEQISACIRLQTTIFAHCPSLMRKLVPISFFEKPFFCLSGPFKGRLFVLFVHIIDCQPPFYQKNVNNLSFTNVLGGRIPVVSRSPPCVNMVRK